MNGRAPRSAFKVDSTILQPYADRSRLVIYNINLPQHLLTSQDTLVPALERIKNLIEKDFEHLPVVYQVTASYILTHIETGQSKIWTGSFFAKNNSAALLSNFQNFYANTFVATSLVDLENINIKLRWNGIDTKWEFEQLLSVIFNVQCTVPSTFGWLRRNVQTTNQVYKTFAVP